MGFCKSDQKSIPVVGFLTHNDCDVLRAKTGLYRWVTHRTIIPPTPVTEGPAQWLSLSLPASGPIPSLGEPVITVVLLAIVTTCDTQGCNATLEQTYFKALTSYVKVVDLAAICAIIGHIWIGTANPRWAIIDRSGNWAHTVFTDDSLSPEVSQGANI